MAVSSSAPSLNRFPGLTLRAWALWDNGILRASFNMASVSNSATTPVFVFTAALPSAFYTFDFGVTGATWVQISVQTANGFTLAIQDSTGAAKNLPGTGYVAVYGP